MKGLKKRYVVIDETGNVSYKGDAPQSFPSLESALTRARALAELAPGEPIGIFELVAEAECSVSAPGVRKRR